MNVIGRFIAITSGSCEYLPITSHPYRNFTLNRQNAATNRKLRNITFVKSQEKCLALTENLACFVFLKHPFWDSPFWLITNDIIYVIFKSAVFHKLQTSHSKSLFAAALSLVFSIMLGKYSMLFFNIRNYSPQVININIISVVLPRVNNFDVKKNAWIFLLLYATNTKQDLWRWRLTKLSKFRS